MAAEKRSDSEAEARRERLAAALRENLKRRKAQQRGRDADARKAEPEVRFGDHQ
jgi:hypothetical protein